MRLIDGEALCEDLLKRWSVAEKRKEELIRAVMADIWTPIIVSQPTIELSDRKKGHWIKEPWHSDHVRQCSACHVTQTVTTYRGIVNFKFCPYCGADMRGESE